MRDNCVPEARQWMVTGRHLRIMPSYVSKQEKIMCPRNLFFSFDFFTWLYMPNLLTLVLHVCILPAMLDCRRTALQLPVCSQMLWLNNGQYTDKKINQTEMLCNGVLKSRKHGENIRTLSPHTNTLSLNKGG